mmetsp:Transcript_16042/g.36795  ORF Transcript_16042/g.36795 Transcript_16042/m.36795 type:complete len:171 (+) Transcript_16042:67-579(+)
MTLMLHRSALPRRMICRAASSVPPLVPPFTEEIARLKVQAAEDAWNSRDPERCALAYTEDSIWRNRDQFLQGREAIKTFLRGKWAKEEEYCLKKHYFSHSDDKIAVTFQYEYKTAGQWYRAYGLEHWTFDAEGKMKNRNASINDVNIEENERIIKPGADLTQFAAGTFLR